MTPKEVINNHGKVIKVKFPCRGESLLVKIARYSLHEKSPWGKGSVTFEYLDRKPSVTWAFAQVEDVEIVDDQVRTRRKKTKKRRRR